jgi:beta-1,4-N-acetylglucosaminyltransferase
MPKQVFVTVGSTSFPELVKAVLSSDTIEVLERLGFTNLSIQYGADGQLFANQGLKLKTASIVISGFDYSPSIKREMELADLIISHAGSFLALYSISGSGSILEALHLGKKLIAVPNSTLMDNHQVEVANALAEHEYILSSSPRYDTCNSHLFRSDLSTTLSLQYDRLQHLRPFPRSGNSRFSEMLEKELGLD